VRVLARASWPYAAPGEFLTGSAARSRRWAASPHFYKVYAQAEDLETIMLTNLMFETIGATTYRLALGARAAAGGAPDARHPHARRVLSCPLNVHFIRQVLPGLSPMRRIS